MDENTIKKLLEEAERLRIEREKKNAVADQVSSTLEKQIAKLKLEHKKFERPKL